MLKRFFKKIGISYKRAKKTIMKDRDFKNYFDKVSELNTFKSFQKEKELELYFFDESGFSLNSNIPYKWSEVGKPSLISASFSKRLNVLGFLNTKNKDLFFESIVGRVDSDVVIKTFDKFVEKMNSKFTVVVLDNTSIHTSKKFKAKIKEWESKNLYLFYLPPYSPELNLIEILWREVKYHWLSIDSFLSFETLCDNIKKILESFGIKYDINFG